MIPLDRITQRYCPTSEFHWKVDEPNGRCPVCHQTIRVAVYVRLEQEQLDDLAAMAREYKMMWSAFSRRLPITQEYYNWLELAPIRRRLRLAERLIAEADQ